MNFSNTNPRVLNQAMIQTGLNYSSNNKEDMKKGKLTQQRHILNINLVANFQN